MAKWINEIPIRITAVKKREVKYSLRQLITIITTATLFCAISLFLYRVSETSYEEYTKIVCIVIFVVVCVLLVRVFLWGYFNEKEMYEQYLNREEKFDISKYWDIIYISDNGTIVSDNKELGGCEKSVVIKMERSNTMGRTQDFEDMHYRNVSVFIREVLAKGYKIRRYNLSVNDTNEEPFKILEKSVSTLANKKLQDSMNTIINYNKESVRKCFNRSVEYYMIETTGPRERLEEDIKDAMGILQNTVYKPFICDRDDLILFFYGFFKMKYIDSKRLSSNNIPKDELIKLESIEEFTDKSKAFMPIETEAAINKLKYEQLKKGVE